MDRDTARAKDSVLLRLVPTKPSTDPTFPISILREKGDLQHAIPLGIPLDQQQLKQEESETEVECKSFDIQFESNEGVLETNSF